MTELHTLPTNHILRNTPLIAIKASYKHTSDKVFREIYPNFGIAKKTFNELSSVWTDDSIFIGELS